MNNETWRERHDRIQQERLENDRKDKRSKEYLATLEGLPNGYYNFGLVEFVVMTDVLTLTCPEDYLPPDGNFDLPNIPIAKARFQLRNGNIWLIGQVISLTPRNEEDMMNYIYKYKIQAEDVVYRHRIDLFPYLFADAQRQVQTNCLKREMMIAVEEKRPFRGTLNHALASAICDNVSTWIIKMLVEYGASPNGNAEFMGTLDPHPINNMHIFYYAIEKDNSRRTIHYLFTHGSKVSKEDKHKLTDLEKRMSSTEDYLRHMNGYEESYYGKGIRAKIDRLEDELIMARVNADYCHKAEEKLEEALTYAFLLTQ